MANDFFRMVLWWCDMTEVLLFSDDEKIFNLTNSVIDGRYKLTWCTYKSLEKKLYPYTDIADCRQTWCWVLCPAPFFF